jgi:ATP/maltotriose-dependent transcriptional regulator MalT
MLERRYDEAQQLLDNVHRAWSENPQANNDRLGDVARTRAEIELAQQHFNEAGEHIDQSLALLGYPSRSNGFGLSAALTTAARIRLAKGEPAQAEGFARDALRISEEIARDPAQSADVGEAALVLATVQRTQGDPAAARASIDRSVEALKNGLGDDHSLTREATALQAALRQ